MNEKKKKPFRLSGIRPGSYRAVPEQPHVEFFPVVEPLDLEHFERVFSYRFQSPKALETALTHRSLQTSGERSHYERLEFLGDAVLDLAIADLLIEAHPRASEGSLSKMRAALVNTCSLADIARSVDLGKFIRLSRGEVASGGAERPSILADVVEAIIGALYKEAGFERTRESIRHLFGERVKKVRPSDPKTELQELLHAMGRDVPEYRLDGTEGLEHCPVFISSVLVEGEVLGSGRGTTKKVSQQKAAGIALKKLRAETKKETD